MTKLHQSLKAMSEDKAIDGVGKSLSTYALDPRLIQIKDGFNARPLAPDHVAYLQALQDDGIDTGYLLVQVIDGVPFLRDGHHRLQAVMNRIDEGVDVKTVKVQEFKGNESQAIFMMLATQSGLLYTPLQLGEQYVKLVNAEGLSFAEIAKGRGMSVQHVKDCIRLTEQPKEITDAIKAGEIAPATALKLVKSKGATAAAATIKEGLIVGKGKPITQKVIDGLGKSVVNEAAKRTATAREHISAMLDSPAFDGPTKAHLRDTVALLEGKATRITVKPADDAAIVQAWLQHHKASTHSGVQLAASLLGDMLAGKKLPQDNSGEAQFYAHMVWLQDMAAHNKDVTFRAAAHWFMAVLNAKRTGGELAPAPAVMSLEDALKSEMESNGAVRAETLCPEQTALINYIRGLK